MSFPGEKDPFIASSEVIGIAEMSAAWTCARSTNLIFICRLRRAGNGRALYSCALQAIPNLCFRPSAMRCGDWTPTFQSSQHRSIR